MGWYYDVCASLDDGMMGGRTEAKAAESRARTLVCESLESKTTFTIDIENLDRGR